MSPVFKMIPIDCLNPGRYQPRTYFSDDSLQELALSITAQGLIEPLVVRESLQGGYEIIAGERRWRAAMLAGLAELPCIINNYSDEQAVAVTLIENIQRENLNLIEEAKGYRRLLDEFRFQQDDIASLVGKSRSHIANILRLLTLCDSVQEQISTGELSLGHARMLVNLERSQQKMFAAAIKENEWSVRQLEKKIRALRADVSCSELKDDADIARLQIKLAEQIGAPVRIICDKNEGGWLQVKFFNNDTFAGLLERMGLSYD